MTAPGAERNVQATRARNYVRRTGQKRPPDPYPPAFLARWRELHHTAGVHGAWTYVPSPSSVAALRGLAEHGPCLGVALARVTGVPQPNLTPRTLPRLEQARIVASRVPTEDEIGRVISPGRRRRPTVWGLTDHGRELVALLNAPTSVTCAARRTLPGVTEPRDLTDAEAGELAELNAAIERARATRDERVAGLHRAGVPAVQLAEATGVTRGHMYRILKTQGVDLVPGGRGGSRPTGEPPPAWRLRETLRGIGIDVAQTPDEVARDVANLLGQN